MKENVPNEAAVSSDKAPEGEEQEMLRRRHHHQPSLNAAIDLGQVAEMAKEEHDKTFNEMTNKLNQPKEEAERARKSARESAKAK